MNWTINRNSIPINHSSYYKMEVLYINTDTHATINKISLHEYSNGSFVVIAEAKASTDYQSLSNAFIGAEFQPPNYLDQNHMRLELETTDKQLIGLFLRALQQKHEKSISEIIVHISEDLKIQFINDYRIPTWYTQRNFNIPINNRYCYKREVFYVNTEAHTPIHKIGLHECSNGYFKVIAEAKAGANYQSLLNAFTGAGFQPPDYLDQNPMRLELETTDKQLIGVFLRALQQKHVSINEIIAPISEALNINFDDYLLYITKKELLAAFTYCHWDVAKDLLVKLDVLLEGKSDNLEIMRTLLSFEADMINKFLKYFNEPLNKNEASRFRCPISTELIIDPVFIIGEMCDGVLRGYDRAFLLDWLKQSGTSPITRAKISLDKVKPYDELAKIIVEYIQLKMQNSLIEPALNQSPALTWSNIPPSSSSATIINLTAQSKELGNNTSEESRINSQNNYCGLRNGFLL